MRASWRFIGNAVLIAIGIGPLIWGMLWLREIDKREWECGDAFGFTSRAFHRLRLRLRKERSAAGTLTTVGLFVIIGDLWLLVTYHEALLKIIGPLI